MNSLEMSNNTRNTQAFYCSLRIASRDFVYKPDARTGAGVVVVVNADTDPGAIKSQKLKKNLFYFHCARLSLLLQKN